MFKIKSPQIAIVSFGLFLFNACGNSSSNSDINLPSILDFNVTLISTDLENNKGTVRIQSVIKNETSAHIYSDNSEVVFNSGTIEDGTITINSGRHNVKVCATNQDGTQCSDEIPVLIAENLSLSSYKKYSIESSSNSLTHNGVDLIYGTIEGMLYSLNLQTEQSSYLDYKIMP